MPTDPEKDRLVVLVSSGDQTAEYIKRAGELASNLKSSGRFAHVFFSGWLKRGQAGENTAQLDDATSGGTRFVLYASPFGKTSYEESVARGSQATWKDEFVVTCLSERRRVQDEAGSAAGGVVELGGVFPRLTPFQPAAEEDVREPTAGFKVARQFTGPLYVFCCLIAAGHQDDETVFFGVRWHLEVKVEKTFKFL
jgi:hypothetical protein